MGYYKDQEITAATEEADRARLRALYTEDQEAVRKQQRRRRAFANPRPRYRRGNLPAHVVWMRRDRNLAIGLAAVYVITTTTAIIWIWTQL